MITIAGEALPETAIWENETDYGSLRSEMIRCPDGTVLLHPKETENTVCIYFPRIAGKLTGAEVRRIKELQTQGNTLHININGKQMNAVFHPENPVELKPLSAKQVQAETDSYYGRIRLLEV